METLFVASWIVILGAWVYLHVSFKRSLQKHEPELYRANSGFSPLKYTSGFAWIDLVPSNGHVVSSSDDVISKGARLRKAYELRFLFVGLLFLVFPALWMFAMGGAK